MISDLVELQPLCVRFANGVTYIPDLDGGRLATVCQVATGRTNLFLIDPVTGAVTEHEIQDSEFFLFPDGAVSYLPELHRLVFSARSGQGRIVVAISTEEEVFRATNLGSLSRDSYFSTSFIDSFGGFVPADRSCTPSRTAMCLNGEGITGRFRASATWDLPDGSRGQAVAEQRTSDSGQFWFFRESNLEVDIKVLDNCTGPTNRYWVFISGLTNLGVEIEVEDTATGAVKRYVNTLGEPFAPILDTQAFATCP